MRNGIRGMRGNWLALLSAALLSTGLSRAASAGDGKPAADPATPDAAALATATEASVREHIKTKAFAALVSDTAEILKARVGVDPKITARYDALLGTIIQGTQDQEVRRAAIKAIGETKNPVLGKFLVPHLAQPDKGAEPPLLKDAIEAMSKVVSDDGVQPLMNLVKDSKNYQVAAAALKAFSTYGDMKRLRVNIGRDIIATVSKDQPSVGLRLKNDDGSGPYATARTKTGDDTRARYEALSTAMVETLNKMTGMRCGTPDDWFALWDNHKSKPADLFPPSK